MKSKHPMERDLKVDEEKSESKKEKITSIYKLFLQWKKLIILHSSRTVLQSLPFSPQRKK